MRQLGVCKRIMIVGPHRENNHQLQVMEGEGEGEGEGEAVTAECLVTKEKRKRKCISSRQDERVVPAWCKKQKRSSGRKKRKQKEKVYSDPKKKEKACSTRWSTERYKLAEESMFRIMKAEGAVSGNPISRTILRSVARKYIGDTGLLDHLLKHMDGQVAPGGAERFRRRHNFDGIMEYWLENSELVNMRLEAGVKDPYWIPPPGWMPGDSPSQGLLCAGELRLLKEEMAKMKRDFQELASKKQGEDQANVTPSSSVTSPKLDFDSSFPQELHSELVRWKAKTEQQLMEISTTLNSMQETYEELAKWKDNIEHKLMENSNSLNSVRGSKTYSAFSPSASESWNDWLGSTYLVNNQQEYFTPWLGSVDLIDIKQEDISSWLEGSDLDNIEPEAIEQNPCWVPALEWKAGDNPSQDPVCTNELELLKEEMTQMKRDMLERITPKQEDCEVNVTPDSSSASNLKLDLDKSLLLVKDMFKDVVNWKARIQQQVMEISKTLSDVAGIKQHTSF